MTDRALEAVCRDCGRPLSAHAGETRPARCEACFDGFLRVRDADFLSSYAELGVTSRRVVAEACLRALVLESPPHRKVLAMSIMEQYVQAAGDLVGLYRAIKRRAHEPVMRSFMEFRLDRTSALEFFSEIAGLPAPDLLDALGLPDTEGIARRCPSLQAGDVKDLKRAMEQMLHDLRYIANMGESGVLALAQMAGEPMRGAALANQSAWLDSVGLRPDQVAAVAIDSRRRTIRVNAVSVDEKRLQTVVSHINAMTRASQDLIYAALTLYQEDERARANGAG